MREGDKEMSHKRLFNDDWFFSKQQLGVELEEINDWEAIEIPHDWLISNTKNLYETSIGWYRKTFKINEFNQANEYISIRFEGVYMDSTIYINGRLIGEWKYGYSTFELDMTEFLLEGENEMIVRVNHESPNSRWYSGAGIYRNIWLNRKQKNRIISDGIYITPRKEKNGNWKVEIDTELSLNQEESYGLKHTIIDEKGVIKGQTQDKVIGLGQVKNSQTINIESPKLWDIGQGNLYFLQTELMVNQKQIDMVNQTFGFREIEMSPTNGFKINGRRIKLFGVCQHHDLGCLGAAMNKVALRRQFEILIEMGANAIRTAHNMPAVEVMELADELGILIVSESFDVWEIKKTTYDYARFFDEWVEKDVKSWVRRDRNCPSLIMWGIGNEIYDTHVGERGQEVTIRLKEMVEKYDYKGHAPVTIGSNYMPWENAQKCADLIKLAGYNYAEKYYQDHHKKNPDWIIYGSETASTVQSRGIYRFPLAQSILSDDDEQCSSLGNSSTSWGAKSTEACIIADRDAKFSLGQFIWTGTDYIGEPTPYFTKNSYLGQIDTAGFKKDSFYIFQSAWTSYKEKPMVHIFPYWDFSNHQLIDVRICSNAPKVELFFNGVSQGSFDINHENGNKLVGNWQLRYEPGILHAIAYDEFGMVIAEERRSSFGDAQKIKLIANKKSIFADGQDLIFVEITMLDKFGIEVANANNRIRVNVSGAGRLIGLDNGDSTDYDSYKGTSRRLFSGKLLAIVAAKQEVGDIIFEVESKEMIKERLIFEAVKKEIPKGTSQTFIENIDSEINDEIPVRKIELITDGKNQFNQDKKTMVIEAKLLPVNTTYQEIEWRITDAAGIDSNIATFKKIDHEGKRIEVTALGDGVFYLRCMSRNGANKISLISQLDFTISGLGEAYLNPYEFISGGLYNASNIELTNGNERGVATDRELTSYVGFRKVDFGSRGADKITIPLFSLLPDDLPFEIWEGMPDEPNSECLAAVIYTKGSKWNTYQAETYKLSRKLKGITTICFVFHRKVHFKGFSFEKIEKAYEKLSVKEYAFISGDSFILNEDRIEKIGNNVSILFNQMDFSKKGITKLQIYGSTPLSKNAIRIQFSEGNNEINQLIEFKQSSDYEVQEFELEQIEGKQNVMFIFLPGCHFNFKWFKFS